MKLLEVVYCWFARYSFIDLASVVQRLGSTIYWISHYPVHSVVCVVKIYITGFIYMYPEDSVISTFINWGQGKKAHSGLPAAEYKGGE